MTEELTDKERALLRIIEAFSERVKGIANEIPPVNTYTPELMMVAISAVTEAHGILAGSPYVASLSKPMPTQYPPGLGGSRGMGWQPIETAPRDGTEVLVYKDVATAPVVHIAWYRSEAEWNESGQYCGGWDSLEDWLGWWSYTHNSVTQERLEGYKEPTHWMPLPEPPHQRP